MINTLIAAVVVVVAIAVVLQLGRKRRQRMNTSFEKQEAVVDAVTDVLAGQGIVDYSLQVTKDGKQVVIGVTDSLIPHQDLARAVEDELENRNLVAVVTVT